MGDRYRGLAGKRVIELGCFERVHTIGLCREGATVVAVDVRPENLVKTIVRSQLYGCTPSVHVRDLEAPDALAGLDADLAHHAGVLYHLDDPVGHLLELGLHIGTGLMLDTHVTETATDVYEREGCSFEYSSYTEGGWEDVFLGIGSTAK